MRTDTPPAPVAGRGMLIAIAIVCCGIEGTLWLADWGLFGPYRWRVMSLEYGAFWRGLLLNWKPNYPGQPQAMFVTYAFLHGGPLHLLGNMLVLAWIGPQLADRVGQARFGLVWLVSLLGGAVAFALLSASLSPMVGASGALFGVIGALVALRWRTDRDWRRVAWASGGLVLLNLVTLIAQGGILAWETHLGGYLGGLLAGARLTYRQFDEDEWHSDFGR
ncbi:rhomboid family intramembrane serine protease [Oceaniovalibus guishaninsula]|nr:rhomboid family intramembrane serine protease [Oceaniovalibus guishaninsula]